MLKITKNQGSIQVTADKSGFYPFDGTITFPTNSLFTATSANTDMITFKSTSNGDVQFVGNYKDITISGRSYDTKQKFLTAFSNLANQGSVDAYTKAETDAKLNDKLTAQTNAKGALFISSSSNDDANSSVALYNSTVKGMNDVAIGWASTPDKEGMHNLAMLYNAKANGVRNIAIGDNRRCDGGYNIGIGAVVNADDYYTIGTGNVCVGAMTRTHDPFSSHSVYDSVAIGYNASTNDSSSVAIGQDSFANGGSSVAIGSGAGTSTTTGTTAFAVAIGHSARTDGDNPIAIGYYSNSKNSSIAIGYKATSPTQSGIAIGNLATATDNIPLVIKAGTKKVDNNTITQTMIQGDANGKISLLKGDGTDDRMVIQDEIEALKNAGGSGGGANPLVNVKGTGSATVSDSVTEAVAIGSGASVTNDSCIAIGKDTMAQASTGRSSIVIGSNTTIDRNDANGIAIGSNTTIEGGRNLIVIGNGSDAWSDEGVVIGYNSHANCRECVSIGSNRNLQGGYNVAIGQSTGSRFGGENGIAIGYDSNIGVPNAAGAHYYDIAIGDEAHAMGTCTTAIGRKAKASDETPLVINAGFKTVDGNKQPLTVLQSDSTGKLSILKGDGTDERIVIQDALSAGGSGGGTVDAYTKAETDTKLDAKQDKLTAGTGITIDENNVISSTGGSGGSANPLVAVKGTGSATITDSVTDAVAIGSSANVSRNYGVSVGYQCKSGNNSVAIGNNARAETSSYSVAIGSSANIGMLANNTIAIGSHARANSSYSLAIGKDATTSADTPMVINAGRKTMIQSDANGKISLLKGDGTDERIVIQDEIEALKNAGGSGGTVDAYTKAETDTKLDSKQDKLTAGSGITIDENNVISSTGGTGGGANPYVNVKGTNGNATIADNVTDGIAIGSNAASTSTKAIAIGNDASAFNSYCIVIGADARSFSYDVVAVGHNAYIDAYSDNCVVVGSNASARGSRSVAIGDSSEATNDKPLDICCGQKTDGTPLRVIQSDTTGKISVLKGDGTDERIVISDEITALKAEITTLKAEIAALKGGA